MNFPTRIEQELFDHLSPDKQAEVEEHYAGLEEPPGHDFIMERAKLEADREDAADAQHERARENFEAQMGKLRGMIAAEKQEPIFDPDKEHDLKRDLAVHEAKQAAIRKAAEEGGDALLGLSKEDTEAVINEMIDLSDERTRLMIEGEEIETCDKCGRLKN